jgi:predicted PurR-regulated permease PerM
MATLPSGRPDDPLVPRMVVILVGLAATFLVITGLRGLSDIVGPAFLALVLTIAVQPMRTSAARHGVPGWIGGVAALLTIYASLIGLTLALTVALGRFATLLPTYEPQMNRLLDGVVRWLDQQGVGQEQIDRMVGGIDLNGVVAFAGNLVSGLLGALTGLFFVITLVLFMVIDAPRFSAKLRLLPADLSPLTSAITAFGSATRRYLVVSTVFGLIVAVGDTIALLWLGVPVALLWGLLAFITNYIPNIGFVIGLVPPAVIALLEGGPRLLVAVVVIYSVLNVLIQSVIQPKIVGDAVGLSSTLTMLSLVFWAYTLGAVGALMAVPLTLCAKALLVDADPRAAWLRPLLSGARPGAPAGSASRARRTRRERAAPPRAGAR